MKKDEFGGGGEMKKPIHLCARKNSILHRLFHNRYADGVEVGFPFLQ